MCDSRKFEILLSKINDVRALAFSASTCGIKGVISGINTEADVNSLIGLLRLDLTVPHILEVKASNEDKISAFIEKLKAEDIQVEPVAA